MKEQIDRLTEKMADELKKEAGDNAVVIILVADATDVHMAQRGGDYCRKIGMIRVVDALLMQETLKNVIQSE